MIPEREEQNEKYGDAEDDGDDRGLFCGCSFAVRKGFIIGARVSEEFMRCEIVDMEGASFSAWICGATEIWKNSAIVR